jgi:hypothetical protein
MESSFLNHERWIGVPTYASNSGNVFVSWLASRVSNKTDPTIEYESNPKTINQSQNW